VVIVRKEYGGLLRGNKCRFPNNKCPYIRNKEDCPYILVMARQAAIAGLLLYYGHSNKWCCRHRATMYIHQPCGRKCSTRTKPLSNQVPHVTKLFLWSHRCLCCAYRIIVHCMPQSCPTDLPPTLRQGADKVHSTRKKTTGATLP
jgi:hypothetical protein